MFRKMRRFKQELSKEECIEILKSEPRGVLSMIGDDGYPYGIPMTHWYCEEDGKIYFHGAKEGHKLDAIRKCDKVSFCVYGNFPSMLSLYISAGTVLLISRSVTASWLTAVPMNSLSAP